MPAERVAVHAVFRIRGITAVAAPALFVLALACADSSANPIAPINSTSLFELMEEEKPVPDASVDAADENGNGLVCSKKTSGNFISMDDNLNTPSQPCPPAFYLVGKGGTVKVPADFSADDENRNGLVCWKETKPGVYISKDDNLNTPSQPCPPSYNVSSGGKKSNAKVEDLKDADENTNGMVCVKVLDVTNDFIVKDDNLNTPSQPCPPAFAFESLVMQPADPAEPPKK